MEFLGEFEGGFSSNIGLDLENMFLLFENKSELEI